ncbi:MAG: sporulation protein YunB [Oscillospiraceae bacterium]|nr:sporulation protein YunB [Oscillospiraceae bacterium]
MHRRKRRWRLYLFLIVALGIWAFVGLRSRLWPVVRSLARTQVTNRASDLINDAILEQIMEGQIQYDRIVYFEKDLNGRITALKTNMAEVNRLKTETLNIINDEIMAEDTDHLGVALGSLILPEFFSGQGPSIPVRILAIRNSDANFQSEFTEAGINQTLQKLRMDVIVDVTILVLGQTETFTVSSQMVVAETIIVGDVPATYLQTGGYHGTQRENPGANGASE